MQPIATSTQYLLFGLVGLVDKMSTSERHFCAFRPDTHPVSSDDDRVDDGDDGDDDGVDDGGDDGGDGGSGDCAVVCSPPVHTLRPFNRLVPRYQDLRSKMVKMVIWVISAISKYKE